MRDIVAHETLYCRNTTCANELCRAPLEALPMESLVKFMVPKIGDLHGEEERIACSKKCKKVARFGMVLKKGSENETDKEIIP